MVDTYQLSDVQTARRRVVNALHAMHPDQRILIHEDLATELEAAWVAYDSILVGVHAAPFDMSGTLQTLLALMVVNKWRYLTVQEADVLREQLGDRHVPRTISGVLAQVSNALDSLRSLGAAQV